jgi:hypothetical protein
VKVISSFGRRYLELMTKVDRLMPMLETLAIDDVIGVSRLDLQKALAKKSVRQVAGAARNFAGGLRQRMNAIADRDTGRQESIKGEEGETMASSPNAPVSAPIEDTEPASLMVGATTDALATGAATAKPPQAKQKEQALAAAESPSRASAAA